MTGLDTTRPHVLTAPHEYSAGNWWGACTCGAEFFGDGPQEIRDRGQPHRDAARDRSGPAVNRERDEERRLRREQRKAAQSTVDKERRRQRTSD